MTWRKWILRSIVLMPLGLASLGWILYERWTDPAVLSQKITDRFESDFINVKAELKSARLRLFGNLTLVDLRLSRRDNLNNQDFVYVPSAVLHHDKRQLLAGNLNVRKIEMIQPRIRLVRRRDGSWNVSGILREADPSQRMPTLVMRQGTIVVMDETAPAGSVPIELSNVELTLVNDPLTTLKIQGSGTNDLLGPVRIAGRLQRSTGELTIDFEAQRIPLGQALVRAATVHLPEVGNRVGSLDGVGSLKGTLSYNPELSPSIRYDVSASVGNVQLRSPAIPWNLTNLRGSLRLVNGTVPQANFRADAGAAELEGSIRDLVIADMSKSLTFSAWCQATTHLRLTAHHLNVDDDLCDCWRESLQEYRDEYAPSGRMTVSYAFDKLSPSRWRKHWTVQAEDARVRYVDFPYPVRNVRGTIEIVTLGAPRCESLDPNAPEQRCASDEESHHVRVNLSGSAGGAPVTLTGTTNGPESTSEVDLTLIGKDLAIDDTLKQSMTILAADALRVAEAFHPTGQVDFTVDLTRKRGTRTILQHSVVKFHDAAVRYDELPLPLFDVTGTLELFPDHWEFRDFVGRYKKRGIIRASGRSHPNAARSVTRLTTPYPFEGAASGVGADDGAAEKDERVSVTIEGDGIPLDDDFEKALTPGRESLAIAWRKLALTGRMNFIAVIDELPDKPRDIDVTVSVGGCRLKPSFLPYSLDNVSGTVRYVADSVYLTNIQGRHGGTHVVIDNGTILLKELGGYWAKLDKIRALPLRVDEEFLDALPPGLRKGLREIALKDPVSAESVLVIDQPSQVGSDPTLYWKTSVKLSKARLQAGLDLEDVTGLFTCEGLHKDGQLRDVIGRLDLKTMTALDQPLRNVKARYAVSKSSPDVVQIRDLNGQLFGGALGGQASIELGSIFRYSLYLKASQVKLEEFGRHNLGKDSDLSGLANAAIYLEGKGTGIGGLKGSGNVDVPNGKIAKLPFLLALLKWLGLRVPDRTAFEQAHVTFEVNGNQAKITKLDLYGNAISVRGSGMVDLDGSNLDLDLNADWGRLSQLLPAGIDKLSRGISNQLLKIKATGRLRDVQFKKRFVPAVTEPLQNILQRKMSR